MCILWRENNKWDTEVIKSTLINTFVRNIRSKHTYTLCLWVAGLGNVEKILAGREVNQNNTCEFSLLGLVSVLA